MKISTNLKIESNSNYSFVNIIIHLGRVKLGDENSFEIKGTVILGLLEVIKNIQLLINDSISNDDKINLENIDLEEYIFTMHDLLPRNSNLFDGDDLVAFKVKENEFMAICKPYEKDIVIIHKFPISEYLQHMLDLMGQLNSTA